MRAPGRSPMPAHPQLLEETNILLSRNSLPLCNSIEPVVDQDTANPVVIGHADDRQYVVKVNVRHPAALQRQLVTANVIANRSGIPMPRHLCCSADGDALALMVMEMMPGEQLRILFQRTSRHQENTLAEDLGRCLGRFHLTRIEPWEISDWPDPTDTVTGFFNWVKRENSVAFKKLKNIKSQITTVGSEDEEESIGWLDEKVADIQAYIHNRLQGSILEPVSFGLVKSDVDLRDALGLLTPAPHISALLDWERVNHGEQMWQILSLFVRFHMIHKAHLWLHLRKGYEDVVGVSLKPHKLCDVYVMTRSLISISRSDIPDKQSVDIIRGLLDGTLTPLAH